MKSAVVIVPTTGADSLEKTIESIARQSYSNLTALIVIDGKEHRSKVEKILDNKFLDLDKQVVCLSENVGANGFYGHRVYAAFSHLVNKDYVFFLDQDCWLDCWHVSSMIKKLEETNSDWVYSLRSITDKDGKLLTLDNCESLGKWESWTKTYHIDTNCYCLKQDVAWRIAGTWHGGWGQDRVVFQTLKQYFPKFECTGEYTLNYRLAGNDGSVTEEFFKRGNQLMMEKYAGETFPWSIS
jgi:glycosyltransferase involved in cell wall biosynthesis